MGVDGPDRPAVAVDQERTPVGGHRAQWHGATLPSTLVLMPGGPRRYHGAMDRANSAGHAAATTPPPATSGDVVETSFDGSLGRAIGALEGLAAQSWSPDVLERWRPLFEPQAALSVPAGNVVMVVGTSDRVTPFPGAVGLARLWQVPPENFFVRPQGHFSVALGLERDPAPFVRLIDILKTVRR